LLESFDYFGATMKNFLWFTLVVGLCISSSCGKEKLKIDLPENFQVDFIKSFARVMRSDYPNCHINPQEMFGKVGQEFLKRARAGGMGIHLEEENGRSKRAVDGILAKLKAPFGGLGKRSVDENNGEASQRTKRSPQAPLLKLKNFLGKRSTGEEDGGERMKRSLDPLTTKLTTLKASLGLGKRSTGEEDGERTKRALDPITKLTTKLASLKAPLGFTKRSTGEDDEERTKRALDPLTKLTTKLTSLKAPLLAPLGLRKRSAGEENDGERRKRSLEGLTGLKTALKGTLGLGKRSIDENKEETNLRTKRSLETLTGLKTALKGTLGLGKRSIDEDSETSQKTKRSLEALKSTLGLTGKLGKRSVDDVWTPEDEYLAQKFNVGRVLVTDEGTFPFLDVSEGARSSDGNHQGLRNSQGLPTKLKSKIELGRNNADDNVWTPEDEALAKKFNVGRVRVSAQDSIPSHDGKRPSDGYIQTLQRAQDQETLPTSQETLRRSQGLATKLKSEIGLRKNSVDNVWTPEDEEIAKNLNVDRVRYSHVVSEGASPSQGNHQGFKNSQTGFGPKRKIGLGSQPAQTETEQNRERRSAFEMLMENIDEVKVKKSADLNQGNAKRKRRSLMDLLSDPGQAGNVEF